PLLTAVLFACTLGLVAPALAAPAADPQVTELRFEPKDNALYLPFEGSRPPIATISTSGKSLVIDVPRAGFAFAEWYDKIERSPLVRGLVAAYDPEIKGVHVIIEGLVPLTAEPDLSYAGKGLRFLLLPKDPRLVLTMPRPTDVMQRISVVPRDSGALPTPLPAARGSQWTLSALRFGFTTGPTTEQYAPEAIAGGAQGVGRFLALWEPTYGEYSVPLRLGRGAYHYEDPDYAGVDHLRAETSMDLSVARNYALGPVRASSGLGYQATLTQVQSSAKVVTPTFFFAGYQVMHGPSLRQTFAGSLWGPLGLGVELGWTPYVFANVEGGTTMPWLTTMRVEPKLYLFPDERVSLGYFYERTVGASFNRESSGVALGMSFSGF
ncbi:MAG TPA: hypothetical protein V6D05_13045, partial [Stenomitos sp.]